MVWPFPSMKKTEDGENLVWTDKEGTYKMGFSQYLQYQQLVSTRLLFLVTLILLAGVVAMGVLAFSAYERIDAMDPIVKLAQMTASCGA